MRSEIRLGGLEKPMQVPFQPVGLITFSTLRKSDLEISLFKIKDKAITSQLTLQSS
jgi:hypothetical protein